MKFLVNGSFWTKTTTSTSIYRAAASTYKYDPNIGDYVEKDYIDLNVSDERSYDCNQYYGIRPVVTLQKSYL